MRTPAIRTLTLLAALLACPAWAGDGQDADVGAGNIDSNGSPSQERTGIAVASGADEEPAASDEAASSVATDEAEAPPVTGETGAERPLSAPSDGAIISGTRIQPDGAPPELAPDPTIPPRE